ncbi:MFS transporter [Gordonia aurantiaca]|uniref:MFS transporter n=1 Tax=Gordonia sp. B21 TaxID=3151852 RepID=UPI003266E68C
MSNTRARLGWSAVSLAVFASAWGGNEFTPLLVMYRQISGLSPVVVDALLFAYVLGIVPALLIGGPLSDRLGRRPLMLPAPVFAALGSVLLAAGSQSVALLTVGRICSGIALGLSMAVGGSWIKELSDRDGARVGAGAGRAAMSLTAGFGIGAGVAGVLAEWGPKPHILPYALNIAIAICALALLMRVPETRLRRADPRPLRDDLRIRAAGHRRFLFVVVPLAPWVFGAAASAYAIIPALMSVRTTGAPIAFAALCCVLGLGAGFGIQSIGRRINVPGSSRGIVVALTTLVAGMLVAALAAHVLTVWLALVAATLLGCGYGMALITGLLEVQRIADPDDLAGLTAVFYSFTYLGFAVPALLAWISETWTSITYTEMFGFGAVVALACLAISLAGHARHRPEIEEIVLDDAPDEAAVTGQPR